MTLRALVWLCLILLPAQALAQGNITGIARDGSGAALPGVVVELSAATASSEPARTTVTDRTGRYEFRDVPIGAYSVTLALPGFRTVMRDGLAVVPGQTATVDAVLRPAPIAETLQVPPPVPPFGRDTQRRCLHTENETLPERERREDALAAMRLFDRIVRTFGGARTQSPSWDEVSESSMVRRLRTQGDELAMKIRWGSSEPLPGWGLAWVTSPARSRFALTDLRDPCGFSYSSQDPNVVPPSGLQLL